MDQVALKNIEDAVFQFDIKRYIDNTTKTDEEINEKYLKGEVRIVTEQARYPLSTIKDMFNGKDYILNPDFQRRLRWDRIKQSKLIESFIINVPIPPIFLYEKDYSVYEVMDGLQRITAIKEFYEDKYALEGLEIWPELNSKKYSSHLCCRIGMTGCLISSNSKTNAGLILLCFSAIYQLISFPS